jgi:hypothetical protein
MTRIDTKDSAPTVSAKPTEEPDQPEVTPGGFLQQPFAQNVLPFITSLSVHAGVLILGLMVFGAVKMAQIEPSKDEIVIPDTPMVDSGPPGGIPNVGLNNDALRVAMQDKEPESVTKGFSDVKGSLLEPSASGESGASANIFSEGSLASMGGGTGPHGPNSGGDGLLAVWGNQGGGAIGVQGGIFGKGRGNARLIVFLCDATGSMINKMPTLKDELNKAVVGLKPNQSFDIIFYQGEKIEPMAPAMIAATPENKRKAGTYLEGVTATDTTEPVAPLIAALKLKPQLLYFLTDAADFPDVPALLGAIKKYNSENKTKINTILFVENKAERERNADSEGLMKQIATDSGGLFRWVQMDEIP